MARKKANHVDVIAKEHARLDLIERQAALEKRKQEMREKGLLPPKVKSCFKWKGEEFSSVAEFKNSPAYQKMLQERQQMEKERAAKSLEDQRRQEEAAIQLKKYRNMSILDWERLEHQKRAAQILESLK